MAEGLIRSLGRGHELRLPAPEAVAGAIGPDVAVLMLTEVDYRTGRKHDMAATDRAARAAGVVTIWDLAHSAGALPVDLTAAGADFAVRLHLQVPQCRARRAGVHLRSPRPAGPHCARRCRAGWATKRRSRSTPAYRPGPGIERMRVGTPPVLQMAALDAALDIWDRVDIAELRAESIRLSELFIRLVDGILPGADTGLAAPTRRSAAARYRSATPRAMRSCRR